MMILQEKLEKMQRRLKTFMNFLNDDSKAISHPSYAQELGSDWLSIQQYLNDVTVAFEFECYLKTNENEDDHELFTTDLRDIAANDTSFLTKYFPRALNNESWNSLYEMYGTSLGDESHEEVEKLITDARIEHDENQEHLPIEKRTRFDKEAFYNDRLDEVTETLMNNGFTLEDFLERDFYNMLDVIQRFDFSAPKFGFWAQDDAFIHNNQASRNAENRDFLQQRADAYEKIKDRIREVFRNANVVTSVEWHGISTQFKIENPKVWFVEYDSSLDKYNDTYQKVPVEIISPRIPAKNFIEVLSKFKKNVYEYFDGETDNNNRIGCHINISFSKHLAINPVKLVVMTDADRWATRFNRQFCDYAKSQLEQIKRLPYHFKAMNFDELEETLHDHINFDKMMDVNFLKTNVIEFRFPGNEYLDKYYQDLIETVQWLLYAMVVATHENFHRQEYLYRLGKLLNRSQKNHKDQLRKLVLAYIAFINEKDHSRTAHNHCKDTITFCLEIMNIPLTVEKLMEIKQIIDHSYSLKQVRRVASTTTLETIIARGFFSDWGAFKAAKALFLQKLQAIKDHTSIDDRHESEYIQNQVKPALKAYQKCNKVFKFLKLPIIAVED